MSEPAAPLAVRAAPPWKALALAKLGIRETPGAANNPTILGWAKRLGVKVLGIVYNDDSAIPWCGLFVAEVMSEAGFTPPKIAVRAKAWADWGEPTAPCDGAVLVFQRPGGGHVGFYAGEDATAYRVLGGNQGDAVSLTRIAKDRCVAVRWPTGFRPKGDRLVLAASGQLSQNEA